MLVSSSKTNKLDATKKFKVGTPSCSNPNSGSVRTVCTADITVIGTLDYEDIETYNVILFAYDTKNHHISKAFTLKVNDINEAPTDVILGANSVDENSPVNTIVGNLDVRFTRTYMYVCIYTRLLYWRDASYNTLDYCIRGMHLTIH